MGLRYDSHFGCNRWSLFPFISRWGMVTNSKSQLKVNKAKVCVTGWPRAALSNRADTSYMWLLHSSNMVGLIEKCCYKYKRHIRY